MAMTILLCSNVCERDLCYCKYKLHTTHSNSCRQYQILKTWLLSSAPKHSLLDILESTNVADVGAKLFVPLFLMFLHVESLVLFKVMIEMNILGF